MSWDVFLAVFAVWTAVGWFVIYVLKYRSVALILSLYELALPWYVTSITTVLTILLWPMALPVALVTGYLGVRHVCRKQDRDKHD
jgi:glycerol-3-phosphate acyltransferase PlsY